MKTTKITLAVAVGLSMTLTACTDPASLSLDGETAHTNAGLGIGALVGAAAGSAIAGSGSRTSGAVAGAIVGAAAGGIAGNILDRQAAEMRAALDDDISVENTGSQLVVTLPEDITFDTDSDIVRGNLHAELNKVAASLNQYPDSTVQVIGHTDSQGDANYNQGLSERRAQSVSNILQAGGVAAPRIASYGRGESDPKASNLTPEGMAQNRRVELLVTPNAPA
ncbi:MAG: OmpA family protein [Paracoccaceae bacterium]